MATQKELADDLKLVLAQQKKTAQEIADAQAAMNLLKEKIIVLEGAAANQSEASQELTDAVKAVKDQAQVTDDLLPDSTTPPVPPS